MVKYNESRWIIMVGNKISDKIFSTVVSIISFILMAVCVVCIIINTKKEPQQGDTGLDGKSAYEIAVANGYKVLNKNGYNH